MVHPSDSSSAGNDDSVATEELVRRLGRPVTTAVRKNNPPKSKRPAVVGKQRTIRRRRYPFKARQGKSTKKQQQQRQQTKQTANRPHFVRCNDDTLGHVGGAEMTL